jgi:kumamolisin
LPTISAATLALAILLAPTFVFAASPSRDPEAALSGNTVAGLNQAARIADEDAGKIIDVQLGLKLRNRAQLDDLIRRVSTPGSPEYGHYLTPAQFGAQFGPTAAQVDQATAFLRANGLQVTAAVPGSTLVDARGTVAAVQQALHAQIGHYREPGGHEFFANDTAPALPSSLAANIAGVQGLNNRHQRHHPGVQPRVCPPTCAGTPYTPTQLRTGFGLTTAPLTALTGTGQTLGLLELDGFQPANLAGYNTAYSLPAFAPQKPQKLTVGPGPTPAISNPGEMEVELDIEVMHALAPGATILVFEGQNSDTGVNDTYGCMVNPNAGTSNGPCPNQASGITAPSNSTSWGLCEPGQGQGETDTLGAIFAQAAVLGQSFFAASGDTGAYDCYPDTSDIWVDSPASDPNVTGVGGTKLFLNPDNSYSSEIAWPAEPQAIYGSGGGKSIYWPRPSWQTGPGVITTGGAPRQVPDVSLDADPVTGYSIFTCLHASGSCDLNAVPPTAGWLAIGGTSAGAPSWAAFTAIYNQYAASLSKPNLGFANPTLYGLASCAQSFAAFHDVTTGDNKEGTAFGYSAGANYDMVTGLGSLRAADLSKDLVGAAPPVAISSLDRPRGVSGDIVHIFGCRFQQTPTVRFGGVLSPQVTWLSPTALTVSTPTHPQGDVAVQVTNPDNSSAQLNIPNGFHYSRSASHQELLTNRDGRLEIMVTGKDGNVYHSFEVSPSGPFSGFSSLGGPASGFVSDPSSGLNSDGRVETFAVDSSHTVWHAWMNGPGLGWSPFYPLGPPPPGGVLGNIGVATNGDGRLEVFARGADGFIWHTWQAAPSSGWGPWYQLGNAGGGAFVSDVTAGRNGDGRLEIAAVDGAGTVWHAWQPAPSSGWTPFGTLPGPPVAGTPGINTNQDGRLEIFATAATDSSIIHTWQYAPSSGWVGWSALSGPIGNDPSVSRNADGRLEVFAPDLAGNLVHTWQVTPNGGWSGLYSLGNPGTPLTGVPQTGTYADGRVQVITPDIGSPGANEWQNVQVSAGGGWTGFVSRGGNVLPY